MLHITHEGEVNETGLNLGWSFRGRSKWLSATWIWPRMSDKTCFAARLRVRFTLGFRVFREATRWNMFEGYCYERRVVLVDEQLALEYLPKGCELRRA